VVSDSTPARRFKPSGQSQPHQAGLRLVTDNRVDRERQACGLLSNLEQGLPNTRQEPSVQNLIETDGGCTSRSAKPSKLYACVEQETLEEDQKPPERALLAAIIERAISDAIGNTKDVKAGSRSEARYWLEVDSDDDEAPAEWSFKWICLELDLNPSKIRELVREIKLKDTSSEVKNLAELPIFKYNQDVAARTSNYTQEQQPKFHSVQVAATVYHSFSSESQMGRENNMACNSEEFLLLKEKRKVR